MQHANSHSIAKIGTIDWRAWAREWLTEENKRKSGVSTLAAVERILNS